MATRTARICAFEDESVVVSFDYDDATGDVLLLRVVNGSTASLFARIAGTGSGPAGRTREATFGPGTTIINIPGGQRPRFQTEIDDLGQPTVGGYTTNVRFPA